MRIKKEIRVIGIDDAPFTQGRGKVLVLGVIHRGGNYPDELVSTYCTVDGTDSTRKIAELINRSKFKPHVILMKGIAVGGFNLIDLLELRKRTKLPILVVLRRMPNFPRLFSVLKMLGFKNRIKLITQLPMPYRLKGLYVQPIGLSREESRALLGVLCTRSAIPEPLRVAHIIASGLVKGESRGRA